MKKHNKCLFITLICFSLSLILFGCHTSPENYQVEPLDLLDLNSDFYIAFPTKADPDLVDYFFRKNISGFSDDNLKVLTDRLDTIYCGINHKKNKYIIQAAVKENIPSSFVNSKLSKNKQFTKNKVKISDIDYSVFSLGEISMSFPTNNLALIGRDVNQMLNSYELIHTTGFSDNVWDNDEMYNFMKGAQNEIRFYSNKPATFLSLIIGHQIDLHLVNVFGSFKNDEKFLNQYIAELNMEFKSEKFLKVSKALLAMTFGLTGSEIEILDSKNLVIHKIQINKNELYKLLVL